MRSKIYLAVLVLLLLVSPVFAASHERNFEIFEKSITEAANQISWSSEYNFQDREFVEDEMDGDETVYQRAWYDDHYVLIRKYNDKTWSKSYVSHFWTDSDALTFADGIQVGSSLDDLKAFFGRRHVSQNAASQIYYVYQLEEDSDAPRGILLFSVRNNTITSIGFYAMGSHTTSKMHFLFELYAKLFFAEVRGERVNVRKNEGYLGKDKVLFQVSQSRGDCLLVDLEGPSDGEWCYVYGRIVNDSLRTVPSCYVSRQFLRPRNLTLSEKKRYFSRYLNK